jgi:hypothetical protein
VKIETAVKFFGKKTDAIEVRRACIDGYTFGKQGKYSADGFDFVSGSDNFDADLGWVCASKQ